MEFDADKYKIFDTILKNEDYQNDEIIEVIGKALSICCPFTWERINKILLNIINFNEEELKKECYKGLPDDLPSLRALIWKINFRYLPHDIKKWKDSLQSKRNEYLEIKNAFILRIKEEIKIFEELEKEKENNENHINDINNINDNKNKDNDEIKNNCDKIDDKKIGNNDNNNNKENTNDNIGNIINVNNNENDNNEKKIEINNKNIKEDNNINEKNGIIEKNNNNEIIKNNEIINNNDTKINSSLKNDIKNNQKFLSSLAECTDRNLLEMINKDINRTHMNMHFFNNLANNKKKISEKEISQIIFQKRNCTYTNYKQVYTKGRDKKNIFENETHSDVIERIIYIYSKLNKEVSYVQGMNELIAPIYYCFCIDNTVSLENVEADTFWCFTFMMKDIKKLFLKENDNLKGGILDRVFTLDLIIKTLQKDIYKILTKNNVNIFHFAFSWINVFFCQEFLMPDIIRLWDIIFSEKDRFCFVYFFSMAILQYKKNIIEKQDFCNIIGEMKNLQDENIEKIIEIAVFLKKKI